jgi:FixJ family two-component response regulator
MFQHPANQPLKSRDSTVLENPVVLVVDDDPFVREGLSELIMSIGLCAVCFASTQELLASGDLDRPGCLILDVRLPGSSGLDLQHRLTASGNRKPIIFLTGHGDIPMTVQAMKAGAVDFLIKPVRDQALLDAIVVAMERDRSQRESSLHRGNLASSRRSFVVASTSR